VIRVIQVIRVIRVISVTRVIRAMERPTHSFTLIRMIRVTRRLG
jgi:hypothetical protein